MVCGLCLLLPPTLAVHLLQHNMLCFSLYVSYCFLSHKALSLKAVGIQKQVLAVSLPSCAGEHHVQLAEGLGMAVG